MHCSKAGRTNLATISVSVFLKEQDYKQLRIERFRRHLSTSQCLSQALYEMLEDKMVFLEAMRLSRIECELLGPREYMWKVRIFLPLDLILKLHNIYQTDLVGRDFIITQALCIYVKKRKEGEEVG